MQPISTRERHVSEPTSELELGPNLPSRSPRSTSAPEQTYPHTYPPSRRKSRISTPQTGQSRSHAHSSKTSPNIVRLGPAPEPYTPVPVPAVPAQPNYKYPTATGPAAKPPPPRSLSLPTPAPILLPSLHRQKPQQRQQQQQKRMAAEHRDQRDGKPGLRTWWQHITTTQKPRPSDPHTRSVPKASSLPQEYVPPPPGAVFGRPLKDSLRYASVQISTADATGRLYVWGYIPVVVAKWCVELLYFIDPPLFLLSTSLYTLPFREKSAHICRPWVAVAHLVACF